MTTPKDSQPGAPERVVISIDAMGGDKGPAVVVSGMDMSAKKNPELAFIVHGDEAVLGPLVAKKKHLRDRVEIRHAEKTIDMTDKPSRAMRTGKGSSMWGALDSVKHGEAAIAVSLGNTGALMASATLRLRRLPGINRPAIAILWPSRSEQGFNVMLDVGADIRADGPDLLQYAVMGASYARNGLDITRPRIGLLNVGTEEHKGRAELHEAHDLITRAAPEHDFDFVGYVEGGDIPGDRADVIVTDGFSGNIALKTGEGTASLIGELLRESFKHTIFSQIGAVFAATSLRRLAKRIDPRRKNGGVFLGLNGAVVKSHGGADATGVSAAIKFAFHLAKSGFNERLAARVASGAEIGQISGTQQKE
ncbi:phosphate acyltransferase PlsX [Paracoccaceae bacterium GXU_MW_L88]